MEYDLKLVKESDKEFIYKVKKASNYKYIEKIWGWNEGYQVRILSLIL